MKEEKDVNEQREQPQGVEDQNRGLKVHVAFLRAALIAKSVTVDIETQNSKLENYVLQKEVQGRPVRVNIPAVATYTSNKVILADPTISCSLLFPTFNSFLPQPPQSCILGQ